MCLLGTMRIGTLKMKANEGLLRFLEAVPGIPIPSDYAIGTVIHSPFLRLTGKM